MDINTCVKNSNKWKCFKPPQSFLWAGVSCKHYIRLQVKSTTMCSHVQGFREKNPYLFLYIQENIRISHWVLYVPIFYNSELNLITGIQAHSLDVFIDFR